jgi:hypothetical protein
VDQNSLLLDLQRRRLLKNEFVLRSLLLFFNANLAWRELPFERPWDSLPRITSTTLLPFSDVWSFQRAYRSFLAFQALRCHFRRLQWVWMIW